MHFRDTTARFFSAFPICTAERRAANRAKSHYVNPRGSKSSASTTNDKSKVTCPKCLAAIAKIEATPPAIVRATLSPHKPLETIARSNMHQTYVIPASNLEALQARLAKLDKRASKLKVAGVSIRIETDHHRCEFVVKASGDRQWLRDEQVRPLGSIATGRTMEWKRVTIDGVSPTLNGWTFVATLASVQAEEETLNILREVPGEKCPLAFRTRIGECDHCKQRRNRKKTFVVRDEQGVYKCVGRMCLKDFLGFNADPHSLASYAEHLMELDQLFSEAQDESWSSSGGQCFSWDLELMLAQTLAVVDKKGWMSRGNAYKLSQEYCDGQRGSVTATADFVLYLLLPCMSRDARDQRDHANAQAEHAIADKHVEEARQVIDWAKGIDQFDDNTYLANINTIARMGSLNAKMAGLACSMFTGYRREKEQEIKRTQIAKRPAGSHAGTIGKREVFKGLKLVRTFAKESHYGTTTICSFSDEQGRDFVWFASSSVEDLEEGRVYDVKATVKSHGEFANRPQTVLSRLSVLVGGDQGHDWPASQQKGGAV